jgi:putative endonuclease
MDNKSLGQYGEDLAAKYLQRKGHWILQKNFKNKIGEIDIITKDHGTICFVEIKTRMSLTCGEPYESVHIYKQRKMAKVAMSFLLQKFGTCDVPARFDVVSIYKGRETERIEHIINAFDLGV